MEAEPSSSSLHKQVHNDTFVVRQLACVSCRAAKVKCKPLQDNAQRNSGDPCMRCVKHGLRCRYPARKKRGERADASIERQAPGDRHESSSSSNVPLPTASPATHYFPDQVGFGPLTSNHPLLGQYAFPIASNEASSSIQTPALNDLLSMFDSPNLGSNTANKNGHERIFNAAHQPNFLPVGSSSSPGSDSLGQVSNFASVGSHAQPIRLRSRPRATMSFTQEVQEIKDEIGIPPTRDVSRNASPEREDRIRYTPSPPSSGLGSRRNEGLQVFWQDEPVSQMIPPPIIPVPDLPGLLNVEEVTYLFERFFEYHNNCIGLLDPVLHTPAFCFSTSPLLFHAILAVTAGTFRLDKYVALWERTKSMISLAFGAAEESVELCQAVSLVNNWNDVEDKSGSLRFGFAVRIAYQLGLNRPPVRPLPSDEMAARLELNRERTWIHLSLFESLVNGMYGGMPPMMQPEPAAKIEAWYMDHPQYHSPADIILVTSSSLVPILGDVLSLQGDTIPDSLQRKKVLEKARPLRYEWSMIWLGRKPLGTSLSHATRTYFQWAEKAIARDITNVARLTADDEEGVESLWNDIFAALDSIRQIAIDTSPRGILFWGLNSVALHVSKCGLLLTKHIASLTPATAKGVMAIFGDIYHASSVGTTAGSRRLYLKKLFGSLLRICTRRLAAARTVSEGGEGMSGVTVDPVIIAAYNQLLPWSDDGTSMDLQSSQGSEDQRQLEAFIDDYVMQFSNEHKGSFHAGDSVSGADALQGGLFPHQHQYQHQ